MRTFLAVSIRRPFLKPWSLFALSALALLPGTLRAADPAYINYGTVTFPPQVDAIDFINYGTIRINTTDPFEASSTQNFTNYATMIGATGWRFDNGPVNNGVRKSAANFVNENQGIVAAVDTPISVVIGAQYPSALQPSYLWVHATNIVNKGLLQAGANGWLLLSGDHLDLSRGGVRVAPIQGIGSSDLLNTNYYWPDAGISDVYWGGTNANIATAAVWNGVRATAPAHDVQVSSGLNLRTSFSIEAPMVTDSITAVDGIMITVTNYVGTNTGTTIQNVNPADIVITNIFVPTNEFRQAVFVGINDPSREFAGIRWTDSTNPTNRFKTAAVQIVVPANDPVTLNPIDTEIYFYDTFASETNRGLMGSIITGNGAVFTGYRPANYNISRVDDGRFAFGRTGDGPPDRAYIYDRALFTNSVVPGEYAGYSAYVANTVSEPAVVAGGTVTNIPGRIQINATTLDMTGARLRGEGEIRVNADHLIGSADAIVDCEHLSFNLTSTNGGLNVVNLSKETVDRVKGNVYAWSGLWSNTVTYIYTNNWVMTNDVDTNGTPTTTNIVQESVTNSSSVNLYALVFDASRLLTQLPVKVWDLVTHSTNVVLTDNMRVVEAIYIDGESLTLDGDLSLTSFTRRTILGGSLTVAINDWVYTNAPNLRFFTNHGVFTIPNNAHFGDDRDVPYSTFVNTGSISSISMAVRANYFDNRGTLNATSPLRLHFDSGTFDNGQSSSRATEIFGGELRLNRSRITANGRLTLIVTNALWDAGGQAANTITVKDGFNVPIKPASGDLLGTTLDTSVPNFAKVDHFWPGEDRGLSTAGYQHNLALGKLVVSSVGRGNPLLFFAGSSGHNAMYVDQLDLIGAGTNIEKVIQIDPSLTIYFASARLGFTPPVGPNNIPQSPEEYLDGKFGGRLRWVSGFTGPNSSVAVLVDGKTVIMNSGLRNSRTIDSDNDGIPNFFDTTPLGGASGASGGLLVSAALAKPGQGGGFAITWTAGSNTVYQIESASDLADPRWQLLQKYTNSAPVTKSVTVWDTTAPAGVSRRFYRVGVSPQ